MEDFSNYRERDIHFADNSRLQKLLSVSKDDQDRIFRKGSCTATGSMQRDC